MAQRWSRGEPFWRRPHLKYVAAESVEGDSVDPQLKQLMKELGDAINESLSDSEQISEVVSRIKEGGYDIFLVLEATIGVSKQGEKSPDKTSLVTTLSTNPEFKINDQDLKFLKSLRIKIDEDKLDKDRPDKGKNDKDK
jgi:pentose-5-phosphate-3-epimerase